MKEEENNSDEPKEKTAPEETSQEAESSGIPEEWKKISIQDFVDQGFRPRVKKVGGVEYISLRRGKHEKGLGPFTEDRWNLLMEMFPQLRDISQGASPPPQLPTPHASSTGVLATKVKKPEGLSERIGVTLETLWLYDWARGRGFSGSLGDFLSEVVHCYFVENGLTPVMLIERELENSVGN